MIIDIQRLKTLAQAAISPDNLEPVQHFRHDATPAAVLELIKEIESLRAGWYENESTDLKNWPEELAELKAENFDLHATLQAAKGEIERLKAENEALRKDAGRWQFIRDEWPRVKLNYNGEWFNSDFLEREIDAAMSKEASHD